MTDKEQVEVLKREVELLKVITDLQKIIVQFPIKHSSSVPNMFIPLRPSITGTSDLIKEPKPSQNFTRCY